VWQTERAVGLVSDLDRCQCTPLVAARQKAVRALSASRGRRVAPPKDEAATMRRPASAGALQRSSSKKEVVRDEDGYARLAKFQEKAREDVRQMIEAEVRKVEMQVKARERDAVMEQKRKAVMKEMEERRVLALKQLAIAQNKREEKAKRAEAEKKEIQAVRAAKAEEKIRKVEAFKREVVEAKKIEAKEARKVIEEQKKVLVEEHEKRLAEEAEVARRRHAEKDLILQANREAVEIETERRRQEREIIFEAKRERVLEEQEEAEARRIAAYWVNEGKGLEARERFGEVWKERRVKYAAKNVVREKRGARGMEREKLIIASHHKEIEAKAAVKEQRAVAAREIQLTEGAAGNAARFRHREILVMLAEENRENLRRASKVRRAVFLAKSEDDIVRVEEEAAERKVMLAARLEATKQVWHEKEAFAAIQDKLATANTAARFNELCGQLGVETNKPSSEAAPELEAAAAPVG